MKFDINKDQLVTLSFDFNGNYDIYDYVKEIQLPAGTYIFIGNRYEITMYNNDIRQYEINYEECNRITVERSY